MDNREELSPRQQEILAAFWRRETSGEPPPTLREIGEDAQISSTGDISYNLKGLEKDGYLKRVPRLSRGTGLTDKARGLFEHIQKKVEEATAVVHIPLAGDVVAGEPLHLGNDDFLTYGPEDAVPVCAGQLPTRTDRLFALRVRGDSMIDAMIGDRDIVIMEQVAEVRNGDMAAVWLPLENEMTLKHFYREGVQIRLQPANPTMEPILVHASQVEVQGKVVSVIRQLA